MSPTQEKTGPIVTGIAEATDSDDMANGTLAGVTKGDETLDLMRQLAEAARTFKNANAMAAMAAGPGREMLEKKLAEFNAYHPVLVASAREIGLCRKVMSKALRRGRFGILG
jgi:hypothetical protein